MDHQLHTNRYSRRCNNCDVLHHKEGRSIRHNRNSSRILAFISLKFQASDDDLADIGVDLWSSGNKLLRYICTLFSKIYPQSHAGFSAVTVIDCDHVDNLSVSVLGKIQQLNKTDYEKLCVVFRPQLALDNPSFCHLSAHDCCYRSNSDRIILVSGWRNADKQLYYGTCI